MLVAVVVVHNMVQPELVEQAEVVTEYLIIKMHKLGQLTLEEVVVEEEIMVGLEVKEL
jgi:hypothetical protein